MLCWVFRYSPYCSKFYVLFIMTTTKRTGKIGLFKNAPQEDFNDNQEESTVTIKSEDNQNEEQDFVNEEQEESENFIIAKDIKDKSFDELVKIAEDFEISGTNGMLKQDLVFQILKHMTYNGDMILCDGVIETMQENFGFLRSMKDNYIACPDDIYVSQNQIRRFNIRTGDTVKGYARRPKKGERYFSMIKIVEINDQPVDKIRSKVNFDNLVPLYPNEKIKLELPADKYKDSISTRIIDAVCPIGKGQRALIVAPPRTGKTMLMQSIAHAINENHPDVYLIVLLVDERPEEVTDMMRSVKGEVVSSTFDEPATRHVALAEIVISKAKRLVEKGQDVVILLDSITRLARAYNAVMPSSGKVLTGGVDSNALQRPKRFFGAARNIENGGSLTIIATALVETGSKMDEVIFEEFKGTGNCEIVLSRDVADKRIFPAIDIAKSGTRKEEEMVSNDILMRMRMLRRIMSSTYTSEDAMIEFLIKKLKESENNEVFFAKMNN